MIFDKVEYKLACHLLVSASFVKVHIGIFEIVVIQIKCISYSCSNFNILKTKLFAFSLSSSMFSQYISYNCICEVSVFPISSGSQVVSTVACT